jgi:hypothetical protein
MNFGSTLFKAAAAASFALGLLAVPVFALGTSAVAYYNAALYVSAAVVFWLWLRRDAATRKVPRSWAILVGLGWLLGSVLVASAYLLGTRGVRQGINAIVSLLALALLFFAIFGVGALASVQVANAIPQPLNVDLQREAEANSPECRFTREVSGAKPTNTIDEGTKRSAAAMACIDAKSRYLSSKRQVKESR